ncbi:MAG: carbonic anhydrase [Pseudomonadota bacterium]
MQISRRALLGGSATLTMAGLAPLNAWASDPEKPQPTPAQALQRLRLGNGSFSNEKLVPYPIDKKFRESLAGGQSPYATIVCCSDSRAGPEQIFQKGLGELFVVRNAGNTIGAYTSMGSIEYSVATFRVPLIVVLGHSECGAVDAASAMVGGPVHLGGSMQAMVEPILPAAIAARGDRHAAVFENVRQVAARLRSREQPILFPPQQTGKLKVVGAVYDLKSGVVDFFDIPPGIGSPAHH